MRPWRTNIAFPLICVWSLAKGLATSCAWWCFLKHQVSSIKYGARCIATFSQVAENEQEKEILQGRDGQLTYAYARQLQITCSFGTEL